MRYVMASVIAVLTVVGLAWSQTLPSSGVIRMDLMRLGALLTTGCANGEVLTAQSGAVVCAADAGGAPGGSDTQVQFNDGGAFGGDAGLVFNETTDLLHVGPAATISDLSHDRKFVIASTGATEAVIRSINNVSGGWLQILNSNGTLATPTQTAQSDRIGQIEFQGYNAVSGWVVVGALVSTASDTLNMDGDNAGEIVLQVGNGTGAMTDVFLANGTPGFKYVQIKSGDGETYIGDSTGVTLTFGAGDGLFLGNNGVEFIPDGDGALTILGLGDGSDEDLTLNFDDVADTVGVSSSTGVTKMDFGTIGLVTGLFTSSGSGLAVANVGANSCGTTAATIAGGSNSFEITVGATAGTQCRVTFPAAAPTRWNCVANNTTTANLARSTPVTTTTVDFLGTFVAGDVVSGTCLPR